MSVFALNMRSQMELQTKGIWLHHPHRDYFVGASVQFEPPVSIVAELNYNFPIQVGAFSHLNGGFIQNVFIGRYCSFARDVQIGHGFHPHDWLSVSPLQYSPGYRGFSEFAARTASGKAEVSVQPFVYGKPTVIGNDVWIGNHAFITDGVTIGDGAIIGAGSVVTKDVEPYMIVTGNPARPLRARFEPALVERMQRLQWWRFTLADLGPVDFSKPSAVLDHLEHLISNNQISEYRPEIVELSTRR